jgi:hypothetical protein
LASACIQNSEIVIKVLYFQAPLARAIEVFEQIEMVAESAMIFAANFAAIGADFSVKVIETGAVLKALAIFGNVSIAVKIAVAQLVSALLITIPDEMVSMFADQEVGEAFVEFLEIEEPGLETFVVAALIRLIRVVPTVGNWIDRERLHSIEMGSVILAELDGRDFSLTS